MEVRLKRYKLGISREKPYLPFGKMIYQNNRTYKVLILSLYLFDIYVTKGL